MQSTTSTIYYLPSGGLCFLFAVPKPTIRKITLAALLPPPSSSTGGNRDDDDDEGDGVTEPLWKRLKAKKSGASGPSLVCATHSLTHACTHDMHTCTHAHMTCIHAHAHTHAHSTHTRTHTHTQHTQSTTHAHTVHMHAQTHFYLLSADG